MVPRCKACNIEKHGLLIFNYDLKVHNYKVPTIMFLVLINRR